MSGLCAGVCVCVWCPLRVCTRRARRARTFTSDETAVELPAASLGSVTRPVFVSAEVGPSLSTPAVDSLESGLEVVGMCFGAPSPPEDLYPRSLLPGVVSIFLHLRT